MKGFRSISLGCFSLYRSVRTRQIMAPAGSDLEAAIQEAINMLTLEYCIRTSEPLTIPGWQKLKADTPVEKQTEDSYQE